MPDINEKTLNPFKNCHCSFEPLCMAKYSNTNSAPQSLVSRTRYVQRNEALCTLNNKFRNIYIIKSGAVKAYHVDIEGREHIHAFYFAGEALGYKAIYTGHYISTVVALTDSLVCEVPYEHFISCMDNKPELYKHTLSIISKQLTASIYVDMASAEQRIAAFLIDISLRADKAIPMREIMLPMSRQDIGNHLRLTPETVSRILSRLHKDQIIIANGKYIQILNPKRLQQLAQ